MNPAAGVAHANKSDCKDLSTERRQDLNIIKLPSPQCQDHDIE